MIVTKLINRSFAMALIFSTPFAMAGNVGGAPLSASAAADLLNQLDMLQSQVRDLTGQLEDQQHQLEQMKAQQRDRYIDLDKRISLLMSANAANKDNATAATPSVTAASSVVTPSAVNTTASPVSAPVANAGTNSNAAAVDTAPSNKVLLAPIALNPVSSEAQAAYDDAYALIRKKQFDTAEVAFTEFVKNYPDNKLTGNGYYWLGELKLVLGKPKEAIQAFTVVIKKFPGHNKEPDALYKLGIVNDQLGNTDASKSYLQDVIARFPNSKPAKLATSYLSNMK